MYDRKYSFAFSPSLGLCIANTDISLRRCRRETIFISCHVFRSTLIFVINVDRQGLHRCYFQFHGVDRLLCRAREAGRATNTRSDKAKSRRNGRIARVGSVGCRFSLYTLQGQRIPGYSGRERERERERERGNAPSPPPTPTRTRPTGRSPSISHSIRQGPSCAPSCALIHLLTRLAACTATRGDRSRVVARYFR